MHSNPVCILISLRLYPLQRQERDVTMDEVDGAEVWRASSVQLTAVELKSQVEVGVYRERLRCCEDTHFLCHNGRVKDEGFIILRCRAGGECLKRQKKIVRG